MPQGKIHLKFDAKSCIIKGTHCGRHCPEKRRSVALFRIAERIENMGILSSFTNLNRYEILARIVIVLLVLPLHEFAHGWVARKCGDDTAEAAGRLTLNPLAHVDPFGAVLLLLTGFGWAKPVPINPARMNHPRKGFNLDIPRRTAVQSAGGAGGRDPHADRISVLSCQPRTPC